MSVSEHVTDTLTAINYRLLDARRRQLLSSKYFSASRSSPPNNQPALGVVLRKDITIQPSNHSHNYQGESDDRHLSY